MTVSRTARRTLADLAAHVECNTNTRVRICDLENTASLVELHAAELVILYPEDDGIRRTPEVKAAAINMSGIPQHIVYLDRKALQQSWL